MKINEIVGIPHFHSDLQWWKSKEGYSKDVENVLLKSLEFLEEDEDFKFTIDQVSALKPFVDSHPQKKEKISNYVNDGRIELVGGTYTAPDENLPTGEGLIRNFLYGRKYLKEKFDVTPEVAWEIDEFGHPHQMPQILKKSGFEYFGFARGVQENDEDQKLDFLWEGPDGSKIMTHWLAGSYTAMLGLFPLTSLSSSQRMVDELNNRIKYHEERASINKLMVPFGSDFSIPLEEWLDFPEVWKSQKDEEFSFGTPSDFFQKINKEKLDTVKNKEYNPVFTGCYESRERVKKECRDTQTGIVEAEKFASVAHVFGKDYPDKKLESAWKYILKNDSHDTICGTETDKLFREVSMKRYDYAKDLIEEIKDDSMDFLVQNIDTSEGETPLVVFNSLSFERNEVISINKPNNQNYILEDSEGNEIPTQNEEGKIFFEAEIPSLGYKVYYLKPGKRSKITTKLEGNNHILENDYYRMKISEELGVITSLFDKEKEKELLSEDSEFYGNEIVAKEDVGNLWTIQEMGEKFRSSEHDPTVELVKDNPLVKTVKIEGEGKNISWTQTITMHSEKRKIDFETSIDFDGKNRRVQVIFPTDIEGDNFYETPFYTAKRNDGHWPAQNWVEISNEDYGFALLNTGNPGYEIEDGLISMTLFRSVSILPARLPGLLLENFKDFSERLIEGLKLSLRGVYVGEWILYPYHGIMMREFASKGSPERKGGWTLIDHIIPFLKFWKETDSWERGHHSFEYSIYPHEGRWNQSNVVKKGHEVNNPLIIKEAEPSEGSLPSELSFLKTSADSVLLSALKKSENGDELVARVYETEGKNTDFELSFFEDMKEVRSISLTEEKNYESLEQEGKNLELEIGKNEIKTFKFK